MSRCLTLASLLTLTACAHHAPPPVAPEADTGRVTPAPRLAPHPADPAVPAPEMAAPAAPVTPAAHEVAEPEAAAHEADAPVTPAALEPACRVTRAGTCWGQPAKPRITRRAPGAKP